MDESRAYFWIRLFHYPSYDPPTITIEIEPEKIDIESPVMTWDRTLVRGTTYPIEIIARTPHGWELKYFDQGTGYMDVRVRGVVVQTFRLDEHIMEGRMGKYHLFCTMPKNEQISIHVYGEVDGLPMRATTTMINLRRS